MKANTEYKDIANHIIDNCPDTSRTFEIEYKINDCVLFIDIDYEIERTEVDGGTFESYSTEIMNEVSYENYLVVEIELHDSEGETIECSIDKKKLTNILNS